MKEGFEHGTGHFRPTRVVLGNELVARSQANDLQKPRVQRPLWRQVGEGGQDGLRLLLDGVDLEALVVEAVDGVLVTPVFAVPCKKLGEDRAALAQPPEQRYLRGLAFLLPRGESITMAHHSSSHFAVASPGQ